ncbi:copper homeostasis protein CutC [Prauserella cavernicola]|uniref:PF03932 family protein CutC n=1 Tax=Prauserella cavernicola TaxID=2800127 RepID=A0A934V1U2_9PSEU|nr:copper homeostasis protein CutC [Prauserella cavernicola]MBK1783911.1 copper homeostasis protein CutC [Prauserella cavernicola]
MPVRVEISVESAAGARIAERAGAARVELCSGLADGGLTPSAGLVEASAELIETHVLVRPRPGDFRYTAEEIAVMVRDIEHARAHGAAGVVVGALDASGALAPACQELVAAADGLPVTLHRAIDVSADPVAVLDAAIAWGFARVLTSGGAPTAVAGAEVIRALAERAAGRLAVMACGGVRPNNARQVVAATGVADLHAAPRTPTGTSGLGDVSFAGAGVPEGHDRFETDAAAVGALCELFRDPGSAAVAPEHGGS